MHGKKLPVLVLTAKDKEYDKVAGLDGGRRRLYDQALQRAGAAGTGAFPAAPYQRGGNRNSRSFSTAVPCIWIWKRGR